MRLAIPPVPIVEHEMRRIIGTRTHAHQMLDAGARADNGPWIEHVNHRRDREQIDLG